MWTVRGLAIERWTLAIQRWNRSSPALLGMPSATRSAVPHDSSTPETMVSTCSGGNPIG